MSSLCPRRQIRGQCALKLLTSLLLGLLDAERTARLFGLFGALLLCLLRTTSHWLIPQCSPGSTETSCKSGLQTEEVESNTSKFSVTENFISARGGDSRQAIGGAVPRRTAVWLD